MKALSVVSLLCATVGTVQAQYSDGVIRIGVLNDQSGLYADLTGQGSVWAAKKAIADLCNAAACHEKIEVVFADHQNKFPTLEERMDDVRHCGEHYDEVVFAYALR
jgi:branched-chain amino acid transport system substrate-binding protein